MVLRMRRAAISSLLFVAAPAVALAQRVPGRDLLDFPLGTLADAPVLSTASGLGLGNPATVWIPGEHLGRVSLMALQTPADVGVSVEALALAVSLPQQVVASFSIVQASVNDIPRTEFDPQTLPGDIPYSTSLFSVGAARRQENVTAGVVVRYRVGSLDDQRRGALGLDAGVLADSILGLPIRAGASTFLWRPANRSDEETAYSGAVDGRVYGLSPSREARVGYSLTLVEQRTVEHYAFASGTEGRWNGTAGLLRHESSGEGEWGLRIGIGLRHKRYHIGVARDSARDGIGGIYQFTLTSLIR
jgi:hypothetical protein